MTLPDLPDVFRKFQLQFNCVYWSFNCKKQASVKKDFRIFEQRNIFAKKNRMKTIVVEKSAMNVIGLMLHTSFKDGRNKTEIPPFFHKVLDEKRLDNVPDRINENQLCLFRMQRNNPDFDYLMGVEVSELKNMPEEMTGVTLKSSKYVSAKIVKRGPEDVGKAFEYIYKSWMPKSIYIPTGAPAFIYYDSEFFSVFNSRDYAGNPMATVYVPIKPLLIKKILRFFKLLK